MYFELLHSRLLDYMRGRVRSGEMTERGLARLAGISQPHLHNVLKGVRVLSPAMADQAVLNLRLSAFDLVDENELTLSQVRPVPSPPQYVEIPLLADRLGHGLPFPDLETESGRLPFPALDLEGLERPVAVRLAPDPQAPPLFHTNDVVLLDPLSSGNIALDPDSYYAIDAGGGGYLRRIEQRHNQLFLRTEDGPAVPPCISLLDRNILEVVRARAIWIGRYLKRRPIGKRPAQAIGGEYRRSGEEG
jgi:hypothetical protein